MINNTQPEVQDDHFEYFLPSGQEQYILLKIITYDIHDVRLFARKMRITNNPLLTKEIIEYETELKKLDKELIAGLITYSQYNLRYRDLNKSNIDQNITPELQKAKILHYEYIKEFVMMSTRHI